MPRQANPVPSTVPPVRLLDRVRTVKELLGHQDFSTTMIDTHVLNKGGRGVKSPLDGRDLRKSR